MPRKRSEHYRHRDDHPDYTSPPDDTERVLHHVGPLEATNISSEWDDPTFDAVWRNFKPSERAGPVPLVKEMNDILRSLVDAGYEAEQNAQGHWKVTNPLTGHSETLGGGKAMGVTNARTRLVRAGFLQADGRTPRRIPRERTEGMTRGDFLNHMLAQARECTGEHLPDDWEAKGKAHADRQCACFKPPEPEPEEVEVVPNPRNAGRKTGGEGEPEVSLGDRRQAIVLVLEDDGPKTVSDIAARLGELFVGQNWCGRNTPDASTRTLLLGLEKYNFVRPLWRAGRDAMLWELIKPADVPLPPDDFTVSEPRRALLNALASKGGRIEDSSGLATRKLAKAMGRSTQANTMSGLSQLTRDAELAGLVKADRRAKRTYSLELTPLGETIAGMRLPSEEASAPMPVLEAYAQEKRPAGEYRTPPASTQRKVDFDAASASSIQPMTDPYRAAVEAKPSITAVATGEVRKGHGIDVSKWETSMQGGTKIAVSMTVADYAKLLEALGVE